MQIVKVKTTEGYLRYINIEDISQFYYGKDGCTWISFKNGELCHTAEDKTSKLAKIIVSSTNGNISTLE